MLFFFSFFCSFFFDTILKLSVDFCEIFVFWGVGGGGVGDPRGTQLPWSVVFILFFLSLCLAHKTNYRDDATDGERQRTTTKACTKKSHLNITVRRFPCTRGRFITKDSAS